MRPHALVGILLLGASVSAAEDAGAPEAVIGGRHLAHGDRVPAELAGTWRRLADATRLELRPGTALDGLVPGTYRTPAGRVHVRAGEGVAARASSLVGLPTITFEQVGARERLARDLRAVDHLSLVIAAWRLADGYPWPWADVDDRWDGLAWLCRRRNPTARGFVYDADAGCYRERDGRMVGIGTGAGVVAELGDLVTAAPLDAAFPTIGILVADRGRSGLLDPDDLVVAAQRAEAGGTLAERVHALPLGTLLGPYEVHVFTRDRDRAEQIRARERRAAPLRPDNPIWALPRWRQLCALAGMVLIVLVLLRRARRYRRGR